MDGEPGTDLPGRGDGPRNRMVRSATVLLARDGLRGTGLRDVADHATAPRGSLRHYFPRGKDQLVDEAMAWMGAVVHDELHAAAGAPTEGAPIAGTVLDRFVDLWRQSLTASGIAAGCSIAGVVHDSDDRALLARAEEVFESWRRPFRRALVADGAIPARAEVLATATLAALEGAVVLCRARRDLTPLDQTAAVLHEILRTPHEPAPA